MPDAAVANAVPLPSACLVMVDGGSALRIAQRWRTAEHFLVRYSGTEDLLVGRQRRIFAAYPLL